MKEHKFDRDAGWVPAAFSGKTFFLSPACGRSICFRLRIRNTWDPIGLCRWQVFTRFRVLGLLLLHDYDTQRQLY